jgi:eukaryotic-like serine/threonine-protein kinase
MTSSASDRNLLFGILALQMDFITRDGLIDGMQAWTLAKTQSLGEVLVDRELMPQSQRELLEPLVDAHIAQHGGDAQQSLQGLSSVGITPEALQSIADPDVQASLLHVPSAADREAGTLSQAASAADFDAEGHTLVEPQRSDQPQLRFRILRPHAEGGLGRVSIAVDREFNREVAFKEIKSQHRSSQDAHQRFLLEAEVTGGLEHPGIVPVYGLGHFQDGRPFYAMRFIRGDSLKVAIATFHERRKEATSQASRSAYANDVQFRDMISRFIDVCFAMEYAHSRGVLHRDLKPGNIMLGKYGETLVVDWGLAKAGAEDTQAATGDLDQETPLVPSSGDYGAATQMGRVLGTPQFMSPEQAAGRLDELGPTTDVYSLGATLYQVLTGVAPIGATTTGSESDRLPVPEILKRVQSGQFPLPRSVNPDGPAGLEAICLKAMSRNPKDRYPTAKALLADLKAWLADEPVAVWTEPLSIRARRWVRGHQVLVGIAATALLILATVSPVMTLQQRRIAATERQNAATEKENSREQARLRTEAEVEKESAVRAQQAEKEQRQIADQKTAEAEDAYRVSFKRLYIADMNLAQLNWESGAIPLTTDRLDRYRPPVERISHPADADTGPDQAPPQPPGLAAEPAEQDPRGFEWYYWDRLCHSDLLTLKGHTGPVTSVSFSPDGQRLASASDDKTVKVWDATTGRELLTLKGHTGIVRSVAFSPDGQRLASASQDRTVKVWDAMTGQGSLTLKGHTDYVNSVSFSPNGQRLASASDDKTVKVWDATTGQESLTLKGHTSSVTSVSFSPNGQRLASASIDETFADGSTDRADSGPQLKVWDATTGQELLSLKGHTDYVNSVRFSPDGQRLASASDDGTVKVWDAMVGQELLTLKGHTGDTNWVRSVRFSPDGQQLASASYDNTVKVWDVTTGEELHTLKGHTDGVTSVSFSPDGQRLVSASRDGTVKLWDAMTSQESLTLKGHTDLVRGVMFSPDGQRLASASMDVDVLEMPDTVKVWDATTGQESLTLKGHTSGVTSVSFSPDGRRLASASDDKTVKVWDATTGRELLTLKGHTAIVRSVAFSPDGQWLTSASQDRTVKVWDAMTGQGSLTLKGHTAGVWSVSFSPDGQRLASASQDRTVKVWDATTGHELLTLKGHTGIVTGVTFSPDGRRLASASNDNTVKVWDATTGQESLTLKGHTVGVSHVSFSPDGQRLASASYDNTVKVWDTTTGQESLTLKGHTGDVNSVSFSPDGQRLASASHDGTVKVWEARPWTPEQKTQSQARSLLTVRREQMKSLEDLKTSIRNDKTINDQVRQQALDWCELFWKNRPKTSKQ